MSDFYIRRRSACHPAAAEWNASVWQWAMEAIAAHYKDARMVFACGSKFQVDSVAWQVTKEWMFNSKAPSQNLLKMYYANMNAGPEHSYSPKGYIVFYLGSRLLHPDVLNTAKFKPRRSKIRYESKWWGEHCNYIVIYTESASLVL